MNARALLPWVSLCILLTLAGCGGGGVNMLESDGSTSLGGASPSGAGLPSSPRTTASAAVSKPHASSKRFVAGRVLVRFHAGVGNARRSRLLRAMGATVRKEIPGARVHIISLPPALDEEDALALFRSRPEVKFAELDEVFAPDAVPDDPLYLQQWHLSDISCSTAWRITAGSSGVVIAICDSGVDPTHPDLVGRLVPGWNVVSNSSDTSDVQGHGTAVAGTAAAHGGNGVGVASVAYDCRIMPVRITNDPVGGVSTASQQASGIAWAAIHGANVANLSYASSTNETVSSAAQFFQTKGGVVTISAGNAGSFFSESINPYCVTVAATDQSGTYTPWSNYGYNIFLAAPGASVLTTTRGGGYATWSGTSFSAPIVAGVAALVKSAKPTLTAVQIQNVLAASADDLGDAGWDMHYGYGKVNAGRAVAGVAPTPTPAPPVVYITAPEPGAVVKGIVGVQAQCASSLGIAHVHLTLDGELVDTDTTLPYTFSWDSTTTTNGSHILGVTAVDLDGGAGYATVAITVNNVSTDSTPPTVAITSPANGTRIGNHVKVTVSATDNVGVARVNLYVDALLVASSTRAPFTLAWRANKAASGSHTLTCTAEDEAGNIGASSPVSVVK